jgi:Uma2 family endonuclease
MAGIMAAVLTPPEIDDAIRPVTRHRVTLDEYHRMGEGQVFAPDARIELIEGEILNMAPIGPPHVHYINRLTHALVLSVGNRAVVSVQNSVMLPPDSEPEPDVVLLRPDGLGPTVLPSTRDVLLIIEVADSSLGFDRRVKARLYAKHGIPEMWIADVNARRLLIHRRPEAGGYADVMEREWHSTLAPALLSDAQLDLTAIFG